MTESIKYIKSFVPGNELVFNELSPLLGSEKAIAFLGAGISAEIYPLWIQFLRDLVQHGIDVGKVGWEKSSYLKDEIHRSPLVAASLIKDAIGKQDYYQMIKSVFGRRKSKITGKYYTRLQASIIQMPFQKFVTLNYDPGLTEARAALVNGATTSYILGNQTEVYDLISDSSKTAIAHLHGRFDVQESIVLNYEDYRMAYKRDAYRRTLETLYTSNRLIFIGFGMEDQFVKELFSNIKWDFKSENLGHIAIIGISSSDIPFVGEIRSKYELTFGAKVLFYPSENNHEFLVDFMNDFQRIFQSNHSLILPSKMELQHSEVTEIDLEVIRSLRMLEYFDLVPESSNTRLPRTKDLFIKRLISNYGMSKYQIIAQWKASINTLSTSGVIQVDKNDIKIIGSDYQDEYSNSIEKEAVYELAYFYPELKIRNKLMKKIAGLNDALAFYDSEINKGLKWNIYTFNLLVSKARNEDELIIVRELMFSQGIRPNAHTFRVVLRKKANFKMAFHIFREVLEAGNKIDDSLVLCFVNLYRDEIDRESAFEIILILYVHRIDITNVLVGSLKKADKSAKKIIQVVKKVPRDNVASVLTQPKTSPIKDIIFGFSSKIFSLIEQEKSPQDHSYLFKMMIKILSR